MLLALLQGAALAHDWPQLGLDGARGRASAEVSGSPFRAAWRASVGTGPIVSSPAVADGYVVVAGAHGELHALHALDGSQAWSATAPGAIGASPAVSRGSVFVPTLNGRLLALRLADGHELWQRAFGGQNYGSPAVTGDSLVLAGGFPAQKIVRLSAATGATQWETAPGAVADLVNSSPAIAGGQVVFGMNGGRYQSLDLATGATGWRVDTVGSVGLSAPVVAGNVAYFIPGGKAAALYAADRVTGATLPGWPITINDATAPAPGTFGSSRTAVSSPALLGGLIVVQARFEYDMKPESDGAQGLHVLREFLVALDPGSRAVVWQHQTGQRDATSINEVPELNLSPTPATFASAGGPLCAVASSISPVVRVFDASGVELWSAPLSGATRSSPVLANGLLLVATDAGQVHAFESLANRAPLAPAADFIPAEGELVETAAPMLRWAAATDLDGAALAYQVRIDSDGEVLQSWLAEIVTSTAEAAVPHGILQAGGAYVYAVRSRDPQGAWSSWSEPQSFVVAVTPKIDIAGTTYDSLEQAIAAAPTGATISLGRGLLHVTTPVQLPAGLSLVGAGPHDTILDATGSRAGIQVSAAGRTGAVNISGLTVTGAEVGIDVLDVDKVTVRNVVLRDNKLAGLEVQAGAGAELVNATVVRNGTGALGQGKLAVRSSIVTENGIGIARAGEGVVTSRYNDLFANATGAYQGIDAGVGDISAAVRFAAATRQDFHLRGLQATTDRGDPADDFAAEPAPNGSRVNMGAFGNTASAELSAAVSGTSAGDDVAGAAAGGCSVSGTSRPSAAFALLALAALVLARRRRA